MPNKNAKLTRKGITEAGFIEVRPGVFEKPESQIDSSLQNTKPSASGVERVPKKRTKRKVGSQGKGKTTNKERIRFQLVIISYRPRAIDHGNCIGKYIEDFLVEQGLMPDDNVFYCEPPIIRQVLVPEKQQHTEVFLYKINDHNEELLEGKININ